MHGNIENVNVRSFRGKESEFEKGNPILKDKELCCIINDSGEADKVRYKIGDGKTPYKELPFISNISDIEIFKVYDKISGIVCNVMLNPYKTWSDIINPEDKETSG